MQVENGVGKSFPLSLLKSLRFEVIGKTVVQSLGLLACKHILKLDFQLIQAET
jgi:hypothetical protein